MKNNILLIGATHGDEPVGVRALSTLEKQRSDFDWIIGNEFAYKQQTRCFEGDLNRSAPGDVNSIQYAERRAAEILSLSKSYEVTIDIHGTFQDTGIFLIITNSSKENLALAKKLDVKRVVVWPSFSSELSGPMSEYFSCGLEIECGKKESPETQRELEHILNAFLDATPVAVTQEVYEVYGSSSTVTEFPLKEFEEVTVDGETFFPLLVGAYTGMNGIVCYKMRRRSF